MTQYAYDIRNGVPAMQDRPVIPYGSAPTVVLSLSGEIPPEWEGISLWTAAVATDWNSRTAPVCRTLEGISLQGRTLSIPLDARTQEFLDAVDGRESRTAWLSARGYGADGAKIADLRLPVVILMDLDPGDQETTPVAQAALEAVLAARDQAAAAKDQAVSAKDQAVSAKDQALQAKAAAQEAAASAGSIAHNGLAGRDAASAHPMSAIAGLQDALNGIDTAIEGVNTTLAGKADLVGGMVPEEQLQNLTSSKKGIVRINNSYGITVGSNALLMIQKASTALINAHSDNYAPIVPNNLFYAVRSVSPSITTIPADAANVNLYDASATNNNHSYIYKHTPETAPTYELPTVTDETISHDIVITVTFSASALSVIFTSNGTLATWDKTITPSAGETWTFLCRWVNGVWRVYPIQEG